MYDEIFAVIREVYINNVDRISIIGILLDINFLQQINLSQIGVRLQKSYREAIDFILENIGEIVLCRFLLSV